MPSVPTLLLPLLCIPLSLLLAAAARSLSGATVRAARAFARANFAWPEGSSFHFSVLQQEPAEKASASEQRHQELRVARYKKRGEGVECVFCLSGIEEGEEIRELSCRHVFHRGCLDPWLSRPPATCPLCRGRLLTAARAGREEEARVEENDVEDADMDMVVFMAHVHRSSSWFW